MTGHQLSPAVRSVLTAPRGHRFPRPTTNTHQSRTTPPRATSPRAVPPPASESPWDETYQARQDRLLRQMGDNPRVAYMLQHGPLPHWVKVARQQREQKTQEAQRAADAARAEPEPVLPRGRHRAPRPWWGWPATAISSTLLLGLTTLEILGRTLTHDISILT